MLRTRWISIGLVLFLLCIGLGLTVVLAQGEPAAPDGISIQSPEAEPNDSIWEANHASLGFTWHAKIQPAGDVDYYGYYAYPDWPLRVSLTIPPGSPVTPVVSVYNSWEELQTQATCPTSGLCLEFTPTVEETYFVKVEDANGNGGRRYEYAVVVGIEDIYEPNDFMSQATPLAYGDDILAILGIAGDVDVYQFTGEAGDEVFIETGPTIRLLDEEGNQLPLESYGGGVLGRLPADGVYYVEVSSYYCTDCIYRLRLSVLDRPIFVSLDKNGAVGGVPFTSGDILRHWTRSGSWEMFFDASDMGLKGNLVAFNFAYNPQLVYNKTQTVPGLGQVGPQDIITFNPYTVGEDTSGWLDWKLDGSDVGLTTAGESIDALANETWSDNVLLLSTSGSARVPFYAGQMSATKNDVLSFSQTSHGANSGGAWGPFRDSFVLDIGAANLSGLDMENGENLYMSFDRKVVLDGLTLDPGDIALCRLSWYMNGCEWVQKFFDASDAGLEGYKVDAFDVSPYPYPYP